MGAYIQLLYGGSVVQSESFAFVQQAARALSRNWDSEKNPWDANESGCTRTTEVLDKPKEFAAQGPGVEKSPLQKSQRWSDISRFSLYLALTFKTCME